jgi:hypothetical protein
LTPVVTPLIIFIDWAGRMRCYLTVHTKGGVYHVERCDPQPGAGFKVREYGDPLLADRTLLRLPATLLVVGELLSVLAGILHPGREDPNNHSAAFTEYAASGSWTAVHLGQFAGMAIIIAGLLVLFLALNTHEGTPGWANRFGAIAAVVALALYAVLQAVDGVALKQAVDAWVRAPDAEKAGRFASAETVRWLEWAVRSYHSWCRARHF